VKIKEIGEMPIPEAEDSFVQLALLWNSRVYAKHGWSLLSVDEFDCCANAIERT